MTFTFVDAAPVKVTGTGRIAEPNPFADVIKAIALQVKKIGNDSLPVAKAVTLTAANEDEAKKTLAKVKRQLAEAGRANDPQCSVLTNVAKGKKPTETVLTFWTVALISRPRKPKPDATPAAA
jgi:nucleotide-binding universal stress UspA family protein